MSAGRGNVIGLIAGVLIVFGAGFFLIGTGLRVDELGTSPTAAEQLIGWGGLLVGMVAAVTFFARLLMPRSSRSRTRPAGR